MLKLLETRFKHLQDVNELLQKKAAIRDDQIEATQDVSTQHSEFLE